MSMIEDLTELLEGENGNRPNATGLNALLFILTHHAEIQRNAECATKVVEDEQTLCRQKLEHARLMRILSGDPEEVAKVVQSANGGEIFNGTNKALGSLSIRAKKDHTT